MGQTILMAISLSGISGCDIAFLHSSCGSENSEKVFGRYSASSSFAFFIASICSYFIISKSMELAVFLTVIAYGLSVVMICFTKDIDIEKSIDKECVSIKKYFENLKSIKHIYIAIGFCTDLYLKYAFMICFVIMGIGLYGVYLYISKEKYNET